MNVNKKFGRFKQWAGEKMGGEARTGTSEEFRALEMEMELRHEGMHSAAAMQQSCDCKMLTLHRHGQNAEGHGCLREVHFEARRGRRQGEAAPWRPLGFFHGYPWRGF